jgi:peroxin-6
VDEAKRTSSGPTTQTPDRQLTIGEAVNGIKAGDEILDGPIPPSDRTAPTATRGKSGTVRNNKAASNKGKGKAISYLESDADDDIENGNAAAPVHTGGHRKGKDGSRNGIHENGVKDTAGKGKGKVHAAANDSVSDEEDEYLIKTDHLVKTGTAS